jgi:hypothetical protein
VPVKPIPDEHPAMSPYLVAPSIAPSGVPTSARLVLHEDDYFVVDKLPGDSVLRLRRTSAPATGPIALRETALVRAALQGFERSRYGVLFDLRLAPRSVDPSFAEVAARFREEVLSGWAALATLTASSVGKLQAVRFAREEKRQEVATDSEEEALEKLRKEVAERRKNRSSS